MNRYAHVLEILDAAVGGPTAPVAAHGAFWRGLTRDQFVAKKVYGLPLLVVGNAAASNLVKALAGEPPFGADLPGAREDAVYNRMPSGRDSVAAADQAFIRQWINDGCPGEPPAALESPQSAAAPTATMTSLMEEFDPAAPTLDWLKEALQLALQLELFTLPPYLTARWSIQAFPQDPVARSIRDVRGEEMLHFGIVANLIVAIGGTPRIADAGVVPTYPGHLPGNVRPELQVALRRLDAEQAKVFMDIEFPQGGPIPLTEAVVYNSIGEFYNAIGAAFQALNPALDGARQLEGPMDLAKITNLQQAKDAIDLIKLQGEGASGTPEEVAGSLAHYYRFAEIAKGRKIKQNPDGTWGYSNEALPMPAIWPMADIPPGGYAQAEVPDAATWDLIATFDRTYSDMLRNLEWTWVHGDDAFFGTALGLMKQLTTKGRQLMQRPKPDGGGNYGPCFRFVTAQA
jgi:hypothetical protein